MSAQLIIELRDREGAQTVLQALDAYKVRLRASIERTKRRLAEFERRYGVETARFLEELAAGRSQWWGPGICGMGRRSQTLAGA